MLTSSQSLGILHVVDSLEFGGLERVVSDLAIAQTARGHRVTVFSINRTDGFRTPLEEAGVPVVVGDKRGTLDRSVLRRMRKVARDVRVVHSHNFVPNYYAALATVALPDPPVLVTTCHDMGMRLANRKLRWLYRLSLKRTSRVAMVGRQVHDRFVGGGMVAGNRAVTVLNGVAIDRFQYSDARRDVARSTLGILPDTPVIGCVGRLVALKNHHLMLSSLPTLIGKYPGLKLVLAGEGPLAGELRCQAEALGVIDNVMFLGARTDIQDLLPAFDIFALPSKTEGLSIALLEACASSLAIVATEVGGNPEIIQDDRTGLLVPVDDQFALASAMDGLLADPLRRSRLGAAASEWVREHASLDALCDAYDRFYRDAMDDDCR